MKKMFEIEINGWALLSVTTLLLYGFVSFIKDFINLF